MVYSPSAMTSEQKILAALVRIERRVCAHTRRGREARSPE